MTITKNKTLTSFTKCASLNIFGMLGLSAYILADTFFVARGMGDSGLAALNFAIPIYSLIHGTGLMVGMGGAIRYSLSQNDEKRRKTTFTSSVIAGLFFSVLFLLFGLFFSTPTLSAFGASGKVLDMSTEYLITLLSFSPAFILNNIVICFVRNDKAPRLAMCGMLFGSLSNIVLDYIFIFPFKMGMFGAALATGIAPIISLLILSSHFIRHKNGFSLIKAKIRISALFDIIKLGSASLILELASGIAIITFNAVIVRINGNLGVAAYGIVANLSLVLISIFTGLSQGVQPLLSAAHGAKNHLEGKKLYRYAIISAVILAVVLYAVSFVFAEQITGVFNKDGGAELSSMAINGVRIYFSGLLFAALNIINLSYLSASEKSGGAMLISVLRGAVVLIPSVLILSSLLSLNGVWISFPICEATVFLVSLIYMKKTNKAKQV